MLRTGDEGFEQRVDGSTHADVLAELLPVRADAVSEVLTVEDVTLVAHRGCPDPGLGREIGIHLKCGEAL